MMFCYLELYCELMTVAVLGRYWRMRTIISKSALDTGSLSLVPPANRISILPLQVCRSCVCIVSRYPVTDAVVHVNCWKDVLLANNHSSTVAEHSTLTTCHIGSQWWLFLRELGNWAVFRFHLSFTLNVCCLLNSLASKEILQLLILFFFWFSWTKMHEVLTWLHSAFYCYFWSYRDQQLVMWLPVFFLEFQLLYFKYHFYL